MYKGRLSLSNDANNDKTTNTQAHMLILVPYKSISQNVTRNVFEKNNDIMQLPSHETAILAIYEVKLHFS